MPLGYRSLVTVPGHRDDIVQVAQSQLHAWLKSKGYSADAAVIGARRAMGPHADLTLQELDGDDGSTSFRALLEERQQTGVWTTVFTVHVPGDASRSPWSLIDINAPDDAPWTARPRLAQSMLDVLPGEDGSATLSARPVVMRAGDVDELIATITDDTRRRLLFVAGSDNQMPIPRWVDLLESLLRETVGLAGIYVLDAEATDYLEQRLGAEWSVAPGTVRTYAPHPDLGSPIDARRHRILSTARIISGDQRVIARTLGRRARETVTEQPLPRAISRVNRALDRALDLLLLSAESVVATEPTQGVVVSPPTPDVSAPDAPDVAVAPPKVEVARPEVADTELDLVESVSLHLAVEAAVRDVLGVEVATPADVDALAALARAGREARERAERATERLGLLRIEMELLEDERDDLRRQLDDEVLDHAETLDERIAADELVRHLRRLAIERDPSADVWGEPDRDVLPGSFAELLVVLDTLPKLNVAGLDTHVTSALDDHDPLGAWARKTWEILLALSDYARASVAGVCARDVDGYLRHTPDGYRTYPANRHARDESEDVKNNPAYRNPRVFPVPAEVDADGSAFMGAHFKIGQRAMISPRVHYLDATAVDGTIIVGYIGPHLPTQKTN